MAILLLKVEGLTIMLSPSQEPQERRICISLNLERKVEVAILALLSIYYINTIDVQKYTEYIYLKVKEMATLLLKVVWVTIMPFQLRRRMAHPPVRGGFAFPSI